MTATLRHCWVSQGVHMRKLTLAESPFSSLYRPGYLRHRPSTTFRAQMPPNCNCSTLDFPERLIPLPALSTASKGISGIKKWNQSLRLGRPTVGVPMAVLLLTGAHHYLFPLSLHYQSVGVGVGEGVCLPCPCLPAKHSRTRSNQKERSTESWPLG